MRKVGAVSYGEVEHSIQESETIVKSASLALLCALVVHITETQK